MQQVPVSLMGPILFGAFSCAKRQAQQAFRNFPKIMFPISPCYLGPQPLCTQGASALQPKLPKPLNPIDGIFGPLLF